MESILALQEKESIVFEEINSWSTISNHHCGGGGGGQELYPI